MFFFDFPEIKSIFIFAFLNDFMPIYATYVYIISKTLSFDLVLIFITTTYLFKLISDIPIGIASDKLGRPHVISASNILKIISMLIWGWSFQNTAMLFISSFFWGISMSCTYGTIEPYLSEVISNNKSKKLKSGFGVIISRCYAIQGFSIFLSSIFAGLLSFILSKNSFSYEKAVILVSIFFQSLSFFVIHRLRNKNLDYNTNKRQARLNVFSLQKLLEAIKNKKILYPALLKIVGDSMFVISIDMTTSMANLALLSSTTIAVIVSINSGIRVFCNFFVGYGSSFFQKQSFIVFSYMSMAIFFITASIIKSEYFMIFSFSIWLIVYTATDIGCQMMIYKTKIPGVKSSIFGIMQAISSGMSMIIMFAITMSSKTFHPLAFGFIISIYISMPILMMCLKKNFNRL